MNAEDCIYIDDRSGNLNAAKKVGMNPVLLNSRNISYDGVSVNSFDELHTVKFKDVTIIEKKQEVINKISFELKKGEKLGIYCVDKKVKGLLFDLAFSSSTKRTSWKPL